MRELFVTVFSRYRRIAICIVVAFLLAGSPYLPCEAASPRTIADPIETPYKLHADKLEAYGYVLDVRYPPNWKEEYKRDHLPQFYESPGGKWNLIVLAIDRYKTYIWLHNKKLKTDPIFMEVATFWGSRVFFRGNEAVEFQYTRMGFTTNILVTLSEKPRIAGAEGLIFYDTEKDIYLALRYDQERFINNGLLDVGRFFAGEGGAEQELGTIQITFEIARQLPPTRISEVIFDEETMIVKVDWVDKTRYVKFHPKFLKGKK